MKKIVAILLTLVMLLSFVPYVAQADTAQLIDSSQKFTDVPANSWYKPFVDYAVTNNLFQGTTDKTFAPNMAMTRSMFVTVLARIEGAVVDNNAFTSFTDVISGKWYTGSVKWAFDNGIVNGTSATTFSPDSDITREQICTMLVRYGVKKNVTFKTDVQGTAFTDAQTIASWASDAVSICQKAGIVSGTPSGAFDPKGVATRSQAAKILNIFHADYMTIVDDPVTPPADDPVTPPADDPVTPPANPFEASAKRADGASTYNYEENPIIRRNKDINRSYLPSFDMDSTGFVRSGTKLSDLKDKSLAFFTSDNVPMWSYRGPSGETITEWDWFRALKIELGLNIKYTVKQGRNSVNAALQYMNAGKQCDIVYSSYATMPAAICISAPITDLININDKGSAPGVSKRTMDICKWGNSYRVIAPIGGVDVLWYNSTLSNELGLSDPHKMWEEGTWNWDSFKNYLTSAPQKTRQGDDLTAFIQRAENASFVWPCTNNAPVFSIDTASSAPTIINNWENPKTLEAWKFITNTCNSISYSTSKDKYLDFYEGKVLMTSTMFDAQTYRDTVYCKNAQMNWVPYPKSTTGSDVAHWNGYGMMLPKKTSKPANVDVALKFMELWATRYSESIFDNLNRFEYYNFGYKQKKQFFEFVTQNTVFSLPMNNFDDSTLSYDTNFFNCFKGAGYNVETESKKAVNIVNSYIIQALKFGQ